MTTNDTRFPERIDFWSVRDIDTIGPHSERAMYCDVLGQPRPGWYIRDVANSSVRCSVRGPFGDDPYDRSQVDAALRNPGPRVRS